MKFLQYSFWIVLASAALLTGCAKWENQVAADGGIIGSYNGNYVVRNDSGGKIMDVWVLTNVIVQEDGHGAGWLFQDNSGNVIHLGGDLKVERLGPTSSTDLNRWHEYHAEFESKSYQELYAQTPSKLLPPIEILH